MTTPLERAKNAIEDARTNFSEDDAIQRVVEALEELHAEATEIRARYERHRHGLSYGNTMHAPPTPILIDEAPTPSSRTL